MNKSAARFLQGRVSAVRAELSEIQADPRPIARTIERILRRDLLVLETRLEETLRG